MKYLILLTISLTSPWVVAQQGAPLEKLLNLAKENSPSLKITKLELKQSESDLSKSYSGYLPSVSASISQSRTKEESSSSVDASEASLNASLNLFNGLSDMNTIDSAKLNVNILNVQLQRQKSDVTNNVKTAFYNYVYANEAFVLLKKIVLRRQQQLDLIKIKFDGGREDRGSYLQAKANLEQSQYEVSEIKRQIANYAKKLEEVIGLELKTSELPSDSLENHLVYLRRINFQDDILKTIPEYVVKTLEKKVAENGISISQSAYMPSLDLTGRFKKAGDTLSELDEDSTSIGLNLTIPLFDGLSDYENTKSAKYEAKKKEFEIRKALIELRSEAVEKYNAYRSALENIEIKKEFLKTSETRSEIATAQYKAGLLNYTNWDQIQSEYIENEKNYLTSQKTALTSKAQLDNFLGR